MLRTLVGSAAALSLPLGAATRARAQTNHSALTTNRLTDTLTLVSGAGGNVVVVTADDGGALVNGGLHDHAAELAQTVSGLTGGKPVRYLFNTDWHAEHTGSNETAGRAGAQIIAHENTKQYLANDIFVDWQHRSYKALPKVAWPTKTSYTADKMTFGRSGSNSVRWGRRTPTATSMSSSRKPTCWSPAMCWRSEAIQSRTTSAADGWAA